MDQPAALAVRGAPNPAGGALTVSFALPDARPARLELLDPAGRSAWAREVGAWGAGAHTLALDAPGLAPGLYWLRLTQGGRSAVSKLVRVR